MFSLPIPLALPILNIAVSLVSPFLVPILRRINSQVKKGIWSFLFSYGRYFTTLVPFVLFILAAVYGTPSDMVSCGMESQWSHMFRRKDDQAIRAIQNGLHCCGYNSLRDRAWPFPSRDVDVTACETTQGYTIRCADVWQRQDSTAATLVALASFLNWILLVRHHLHRTNSNGLLIISMTAYY